MKAVAQYKALPVSDQYSLVDIDMPVPEPGDDDLLVKVEAISINPADYRVRMRKQDDGEPTVLGWDVAGTIVNVGCNVFGFKEGDKIWYSGDLTRPGANSEYHCVDYRLAALRPDNYTAEEAAAMPLTLLTAWEAIFHQLSIPENGFNQERYLLIVGAAGGAGSAAVQIAKLVPNLTVIATASRDESMEWCLSNGADFVINHHQDLGSQLESLGIAGIDYSLLLASPDDYLPFMPLITKPFGKVCSIVPFDSDVDLNPLMSKGIGFVWEFMFTRSMYKTDDMRKQSDILQKCKELMESGKIKTTVTKVLTPINASNIRHAHRILESGRMIGKLTIKNER